MSGNMIHQLKTEAPYFDAVQRGWKTFEVRKNDRGLQKGDVVQLIRLKEGSNRFVDNTAEILTFRVGWMLQGGRFGVEPGYCVFTLEPFEEPS